MSLSSSNQTDVTPRELAKKLAIVNRSFLTPRKNLISVTAHHDATSKQNLSSTNDSGYTSIASTPPTTPNDSPSSFKIIEKPVPDLILQQFLDFKKLYTASIWKAVSKKTRNTGDILIKLRYMGENETDAHLYIIIQCDMRAMKRVKKFFKRPDVKESLSDDFKLHFVGEDLTKLSQMGNVAVHMLQPSESLAFPFEGVSIELVVENRSRRATLGGLILVRTTKQQTVYGVTAGHAFTSLFPDTKEDSDSSSDEGDDWESSGSDSFVARETEESQNTASSEDVANCTRTIIGNIVTSSFNPIKALKERNSDWALVKFDNCPLMAASYSPLRGILGPTNDSGEPKITNDAYKCNNNLDLKLFSSSTKTRLSKQPVIIQSPHGSQRGTLSSNYSSLIMGLSDAFVETLEFCPDTSSRLMYGDSGSWVINESTGEVYGHVVGIDAFGEAQVMPIQETLNDIKRHLGAHEIYLLPMSEIHPIKEKESSSTKSPNDTKAIHDRLKPETLPVSPRDEPPQPGLSASVTSGSGKPRKIRLYSSNSFDGYMQSASNSKIVGPPPAKLDDAANPTSRLATGEHTTNINPTRNSRISKLSLTMNLLGKSISRSMKSYISRGKEDLRVIAVTSETDNHPKAATRRSSDPTNSPAPGIVDSLYQEQFYPSLSIFTPKSGTDSGYASKTSSPAPWPLSTETL